MILTDDDFKKLANSSADLNTEKEDEKLKEVYRNIIDILKSYVILDENYYPILATWILGTYIHKQFETYPYLFLNAMKGSGKTRLLKLVAHLSKDGEVLASMKEAVLFRTNSTLAIDEFEAIGRKGSDDLRELLNAAYKKGIKVKRMRKKKTAEGEEQVVEEFDVFRPIIMANIWGMENVLSDRCITLILERSSVVSVTKKVEIFSFDTFIQNTIDTLKNLISKGECRLCRVVVAGNIYKEWNDYINDTNTLNDTTTPTQNNTKQHFFNLLNNSGLDGRHLELTLPLLLVAQMVGEEEFNELLKILSDMISQKKEEDFTESKDISLYDFLSQQPEEKNFITLRQITKDFKDFLQESDDTEHPINEKWVGRALKRLKLVLKQKRMNYGRLVLIDYKKAREKILMFK